MKFRIVFKSVKLTHVRRAGGGTLMPAQIGQTVAIDKQKLHVLYIEIQNGGVW